MKPPKLPTHPRGRMIATTFLSLAAAAFAQAPSFQMGAIYQCPAAQSFKILSCAGPAATDACEVQSYNAGQPNQRGKSTRQQVTTLLPLCHLQTPQEAQNQARGGASAAPGAASQQPDANGFKIGDTVSINTAFGWMEAKILAINGNNYRVHAQAGADVTKTYPAELQRIGPPTERDHAMGLYKLHDRVQVNFEGRWVDSEVVDSLGMEYQVKVPGNRVAWAKPEILRYVGSPEKPAAPKAGTAPKPGLTSCAGKIEGRYASTGGFGGMQITFRSGKASIQSLAGDETYECWMGGGKIYLHAAGEPATQDMPIDINDDGTLQTPMGEIKKKGN